MDSHRHGPHSVFSIHLHLVWVTKYRKRALAGAVGVRVRDLIREICGVQDVLIIRGHVSADHVHLLLSIPPQLAVSRLVQRLKGKTAYKLLQEFTHLRKEFWGRHVWA
jgi:putative transposase